MDTVSRIVRNTAVGEEVKSLYGHACQQCGTRIETPARHPEYVLEKGQMIAHVEVFLNNDTGFYHSFSTG